MIALRPLNAEAIVNVWIDVLASHLHQEIARAEPGHCLRVSDLPRPILEGLTARLASEQVSGAEVYLVDAKSGPEAWRVSVNKVVERRNAGENIILSCFPPDVQLAAGDSVDISTFRVASVADLPLRVEQRLISDIDSKIYKRAKEVLDYLKRRGWPVSISSRLEYLATIAEQQNNDLTTVGAALYVLDLIPDLKLLDQPESFHYRLGQHNIPIVEQLQVEGVTPIGRILQLPLSDDQFRSRLISFLSLYRLENVREWGQIIVTDPRWQDLTFDHWPLDEEPRPVEGNLRIDVELVNLQRRDDGVYIYTPDMKRAQVVWQTTPAPGDVPGLAYFRLELLSSDRVVAWESSLIKNIVSKTPKRSRTIKLDGIDNGVYFFRVIALNAGGEPFPEQPMRDLGEGNEGKRINETEDFLLQNTMDDDVEEIESIKPLSNPIVADYIEAELRAQAAVEGSKKEHENIRVLSLQWATAENAQAERASATLRFDLQRQYTIELSQRLRRFEREILTDAASGGHFQAQLSIPAQKAHFMPLNVPSEVAQARQEVFSAITNAKASTDSKQIENPVIALIDLTPFSAKIEAYARAYLSWVTREDAQALRLDVGLVELPEGDRVALIAPTHPLRLLWALQKQLLARTWTREARIRRESIKPLIDTLKVHLTPQGLPPFVVLGSTAENNYIDSGPLPGGWEVYISLGVRDSRAILAVLRKMFGIGDTYHTEADIQPGLLADRIEMFLRQHPYTPALVFNIINPGDAALIVKALVELEKRRSTAKQPSLRYLVRIFTDAVIRDEVGEAFQDLANPARPLSAVAATLVEPGQSFLFPKLSWSRNKLDEFLETPERFPAHITLLMDAFPISMRVARLDSQDRSSFVYGLVQEASKRFNRRGRLFSWIRRPVPAATLDLPDAPGRSALIGRLISSLGELQAQILAPNTDVSRATAAVSLDLSLPNQSLLYSAHAASIWVITLDPHLGLDYFDTARYADQPGYLLDFSPDFLSPTYRQLLLTTRIDDEIAQLMKPAVMQLGLDEHGPGTEFLIEALRTLSGRLAMQLMSHPSQAQGTLGMILSQIFLETYGLLEDSMVIPLDAHPEILRSTDAPFLRGDLLIVTPDIANRYLECLLVETKCLAGAGLGNNLRNEIGSQLQKSDEVLRSQFDPFWKDPDRLDRVVQSWQLTTVLNFYLDRAIRYNLVAPDMSEIIRQFLNHLDEGYTFSTRKMGLVFRFDEMKTTVDHEDPELPIWVIGSELIQNMTTEALETFIARDSTESPLEITDRARERHLRKQKDPLWEEVYRSFRRNRRSQKQVVAEEQTAISLPASDSLEIEENTNNISERPAESIQAQEQTTSADSTTDLLIAETMPEAEYDIILGETRDTPQFGLIGALSADVTRHVGLDLNGCNTISVFGVQGSGKSYTVGSIIEMAAVPIPAINVLPKPLGTVVFHFNQSQDYPPEFVSMTEPNMEPAQIRMLADWGAKPGTIDDVLVLTTSDTVELRKREFPHAEVEPIAFSSQELTVADWQFLMGATDNDAFYLKLLNEVMRRARNDLTLQSIREGILKAPLNDIQHLLAQTRLDFAARFINDEQSLRSLLKPGRLIIVDLRDEFVEKEQALGLFVTMLNIFAGAGTGRERFNKLMVFDEAHKYMGGKLSEQVIEAVREMRHKGVSIIIASQDPIHVASPIIELSSTVIIHRFNSPNWLRHIQKSQIALSDLTPAMVASLAPGEAYIWAGKASDSIFTRRATKVKMRPRITKHGGSTQNAVNEL